MTMILKVVYTDWEDVEYRWRSDDDQIGGTTTDRSQIPEGVEIVSSGPARTQESWICGVDQVSKLDQFTVEQAGLVGAKAKYAHLADQIEIWAWMGDSPSPAPITLLCLTGKDGSRFLLVERAWLLNENGATLERIAP